MDQQIWERKKDVTLEEILDEMIKNKVDFVEDVPACLFDNHGINSSELHIIIRYKGQEFACYSVWNEYYLDMIYHIRKMNVIEL